MVGHNDLRRISPTEGFHYSSPEHRTPFPLQKVPWEPLVWSRSPENVAFEEPTFLAFSFIACPVHLCAAISSALFRPVYWEQELFVETIAKDAYVYAQQGKRKTLQRKDLDNAIEAIDEFAFLEGTLD
ncbi:DNA polymerase epsilon subunit 4 isoform X1 [Hirundo rustica]|uniref:DNA polymerase epsilon subunit 4 isoform X1 n=1 Tax=Hirundo rustica TaxID=43150 RepID=UPI002672E1CE|nr:DNA polymerase epsilon subunit 4 isoform X1 [Hirundo rustica]